MESNENFICSITKDEQNNGYNLKYKYIQVLLNQSGLEDTLKVLYEYEDNGHIEDPDYPLILRYGFATISINPEDYKTFKKVVEDTTLDSITIPCLI